MRSEEEKLASKELSTALEAGNEDLAIQMLHDNKVLMTPDTALCATKNGAKKLLNFIDTNHPELFDQQIQHQSVLHHLFNEPVTPSILEIFLNTLNGLFDNTHTLYNNAMILPDSLKKHVNSKNILGDTPLHMAVCSDYAHISSYISHVSSGYDVSAQLNLEYVQKHGSIFETKIYRIVQDISRTATDSDTYSFSHSSSTASVDYTEKEGDHSFVALLLKNGADFNAQNAQGKTPVDIIDAYCPSFHDQFIELTKLAGGLTIDHEEL